MKKIFLVMIASIFALTAMTISCKKSGGKDLEYEGVTLHDWIQASVRKKGGTRVVWFQVFDNVEDKSVIESYKNTGDTIEKYPAKIYDNKWIWILVNDRIEIRLIADDNEKEYRNTEMLENFLSLFDLKGMEKVTGPKVSAKELEKFIPKLDDKK